MALGHRRSRTLVPSHGRSSFVYLGLKNQLRWPPQDDVHRLLTMNFFNCLARELPLTRRFGRMGFIVLVVLMAAVGVSVATEKYVRVDGGKVAGQRWTLTMSRRGSKMRCYRVVLEDWGIDEVARCENIYHSREWLWRRVTGVADEFAALELDVTAPSVRRLKLLIGHPGSNGRPSAWQSVVTRRLSRAQARRVGLARNFRYVVLASRGRNLCVEKVLAFDRLGHRLGGFSVPCEF